MSRGRHRRPSKAASVMAGTVPAVAAGAVVFAGPAAHAQVVVAPRHVMNAAIPDAFRSPALHRQVVRLAVITVHQGQSLTGIAGSDCRNTADWSGIAAANRQVKNPNLIYPGEKLVLDCRTDSAVRLPVVHSVVRVNTTSDPAPVPQYHHNSSSSSAGGTYHGSGGMQQCIISRESGGNSQVTNASGHYGLYQFSYSTWVGSGGSPSAFGHASVSEQNQVYYNAVAARGYSDWAPYDGC